MQVGTKLCFKKRPRRRKEQLEVRSPTLKEPKAAYNNNMEQMAGV